MEGTQDGGRLGPKVVGARGASASAAAKVVDVKPYLTRIEGQVQEAQRLREVGKKYSDLISTDQSLELQWVDLVLAGRLWKVLFVLRF